MPRAQLSQPAESRPHFDHANVLTVQPGDIDPKLIWSVNLASKDFFASEARARRSLEALAGSMLDLSACLLSWGNAHSGKTSRNAGYVTALGPHGTHLNQAQTRH